ncbi:conjugal transfer protein TraD (plasmid) [Sphingobium fuliginis]|uniref:Conjugal transfer protein TraD n=1 Tax=Sphingobium fuliginis (strain ATCC 27551) TaxID=336203 RepID=A0A7M2GPJ0_SPHSA|nr:conjugal transfer protein TraD [Sphingobium fuliginis]QOT74660.1 conjugal transfer protein TraD [Sphingobium fuliginis]
MHRRERTRHLIELGGLVQKAGLVDLTDDDRATLYGAMLDLAAKAREDGNALELWKRRGKRAFDVEAGETDASPSRETGPLKRSGGLGRREPSAGGRFRVSRTD